MDSRQEENKSRNGGESTSREDDQDTSGPEGNDIGGRRRGGVEAESLELRGGDEGFHIVPRDG